MRETSFHRRDRLEGCLHGIIGDCSKFEVLIRTTELPQSACRACSVPTILKRSPTQYTVYIVKRFSLPQCRQCPDSVWSEKRTNTHQKQGPGASTARSVDVQSACQHLQNCCLAAASKENAHGVKLLSSGHYDEACRKDGIPRCHHIKRCRGGRQFDDSSKLWPTSPQVCSTRACMCGFALQCTNCSAEVQILNNIGLVYAKRQDYNGAYEWFARACKHRVVEVCREQSD